MESNIYYHIYNRGVAKQDIIKDDHDLNHLLLTFAYYLENSSKLRLSLLPKKEHNSLMKKVVCKPLLEIIAYCLMPNHFHLIINELVENGAIMFIKRSLNSYVRFFNTKYDRVGPLFQGRSKKIIVETDPYLLQLSRYIHLNPFMAKLCDAPEKYLWSSYPHFLKAKQDRSANPNLILDLVGGKSKYKSFVNDYGDYAQSLRNLEKYTIENL